MSKLRTQTDQQTERLIDSEELARFAKVSDTMVTDWIQRGELPIYRLGWRCVRFRVSDVEAFLNRHRVPAKDVPLPPSRIAKKKLRKQEAVPA
jgi:excisionase family DNA binding protein